VVHDPLTVVPVMLDGHVTDRVRLSVLMYDDP